MDKKVLIKKYGGILSAVYRVIHHNRIKVARGNDIKIAGSFLNHCNINIYGIGNSIIIAPGITRLYNCDITIKGSNCKVTIGSDSNLHNTSLYIEDDGGSIHIGKHVTISGKTNIAVIEGKSVTVGDDCLFSAEISFRVGDSHSILDTSTGKRINPSKDITIGNHVWIGHSVKVLKGATVGDNSVIATGAIVTDKDFPPSSIIGGSPAKVLKEGVNWDPRRLPID